MNGFNVYATRDSVHTLLDTLYDIAVIGGGITGAGVARDAALRGFRTILLERGDIGYGTSSRSSRLVHGGLRYLKQFRFGLVRESVRERWLMMKLAPHLVRPMPFLFPVYRGDKPSLALVNAATLIYSLLSSFQTPGPRAQLGPHDALCVQPLLRREGLKGAARYFDCATNDARLVLEVAMDAFEVGARIMPHTTVTSAHQEGRELLLHARTFDGADLTIRTRVAVVAAGPWVDEVLAVVQPGTKRWLRPTRGVHLVFRSDRLPLSCAVVMNSHSGDGRLLFAVPWGKFSYVGTTDTDYPHPDSEPPVRREDAEYLIKATNRYFPSAALGLEDVVSVWAGVRPLVAADDEGDPKTQPNPSDLSREEKYEVLNKALVVVAGGKLTTWRAMARRTVDICAKLLERVHGVTGARCTTATRPLPGAIRFPGHEELTARLTRDFPQLPKNWLGHLASTYGSRAYLVARLAAADRSLLDEIPGCAPFRMAELHYSIANEHVVRHDDFLIRRTRLHFTAADHGKSAVSAISSALVTLGILTKDEAASSAAEYIALCDNWRPALLKQVTKKS